MIFNGVDRRIRIKGIGHTLEIDANRQSIAKDFVAFYQKYVDEHSKQDQRHAGSLWSDYFSC